MLTEPCKDLRKTLPESTDSFFNFNLTMHATSVSFSPQAFLAESLDNMALSQEHALNRVLPMEPYKDLRMTLPEGTTSFCSTHHFACHFQTLLLNFHQNPTEIRDIFPTRVPKLIWPMELCKDLRVTLAEDTNSLSSMRYSACHLITTALGFWRNSTDILYIFPQLKFRSSFGSGNSARTSA